MNIIQNLLRVIVFVAFGFFILLNAPVGTGQAQTSQLSDSEKTDLRQAKKMYVMIERYGWAGMVMPVLEYTKKILTLGGYDVSETDSVHCDVVVRVRYQTWDVGGKYTDGNTRDTEAGMEGEIILDTGTWTHTRKFSYYPSPASAIIVRDGVTMYPELSRESRFMNAFQKSFIAKALELLIEIKGPDSLTPFIKEKDSFLREAALKKLETFGKH